MRKNTTTRIIVTVVAATLTISGCSDGTESPDGPTSSTSQSSAQFNQADVAYAKGMTMHHQQAIEMSDIVLDKSGVDPEVVTLAKEIKKAQGPEIKEMQSWLEDWGQEGMAGMDHGQSDGDMGHQGMLDPEDIDTLESADGERASALFLDQMIEHHEGAVAMAKEHRQNGENSEAVELSAKVIKDQKAEITKMREMRAAL